MSYVEKSVYRYLRRIVTSGIKALFTRKFLIYTIFFLVVILTSTITALMSNPDINLTIFGIPPEDMINYIFYFELAFALAYILVGLFLAKTPTYLHILFVLIIAGGLTTGFYYIDNIVVIAIVGFVMFVLWMLITIVSTYSFSKNLFGSRITGSILFMGKKEGESALFSGILTPLILGCIGLDGYILYQGIVMPSWLYISTGSVGIIMGAFIILVIWRLARKNDVYYTILSFFYILTNTHAIQLVIRLVKGDTNYIAWLNIIISAFFLLNSISKYYRKVEKLDADFLPRQNLDEIVEEPTKKKKWRRKESELIKEEFFISDVFKFISDRGVIMGILGFALAYHSMILQIGFNRENISAIFDMIPGGIVQTAHSISLLFAVIVVIFSIILYYSSNRFRNYTSPKIFRLNFLPPYEDVERFVVDARSGNINWTIFARDVTINLAKKGLSATTRISVSAKEQSIDLAKKGIDVVKTKASTTIEKAKKWGQKFISSSDETHKEEHEEDDF